MRHIILPLLVVFAITNKLYAVKITGEFIDSLPRSKTIRLHYIDRLLNNDVLIQKVDVDDNFKFELNFELEKSGFYLINEMEVFISVGDTVSISISENKVIGATGGFQGNYVYFSKYHPYYSNFYFEKPKGGNRNIEELRTIYNKQIERFRSDIKDEMLSEEFRVFLENDLWFSYLYLYVNSLTEEPINLGEIALLGDYSNSIYQISLVKSLTRRVKADLDKRSSSLEWFNKLDTLINLSKFYKDVLTLGILSGLILESPHENGTAQFVSSAKSYINDKNVKEQLLSILKIYHKIKNPIPDEVKEASFMDYYGNRIDFETVIKKYEGMPVYMDFWAKWCGACIYEFPMIEELKQTYKDKQLETVGISIDEEFEDFKIAVDKYKLNTHNQFFLVNHSESVLKVFFEVSELPKYFLFGKNGEILSFNSPRPNSKILKSILIRLP